GRTLNEITAGKGRAPKPFMMSKRTATAAAVWNSNKGLAAELRASGETAHRKPRAPRETRTSRRKSAGSKRSAKKAGRHKAELPDFIAPQLCNTSERPPNSTGWVHEIKFDGYR